MAPVTLKETIKDIGSGVHRLVDIAANLGGDTTDHGVAKLLRGVRCARVYSGNAELVKMQPKLCRGCTYNSNCPRK